VVARITSPFRLVMVLAEHHGGAALWRRLSREIAVQWPMLWWAAVYKQIGKGAKGRTAAAA
jgi:hypothetical protein